MNKGILKRYSLGFLCLIGSLASCSSEQPAKDSTFSTGKPVEMRLQVKAPAGGGTTTHPESNINRLRMVVFGSMGSPDAGKLILNRYYSEVPEGNVLKEIITSGRRDIYLIANEPLGGDGAELAGYKEIATVADMRKLSLVYQGANLVEIYTPTEIPMFLEHLNQPIKVDDPNEIGGAVKRTMAKVTLNLNVNDASFPNGKSVVIDYITIKNLPESSSLIAQNYTGNLTDSEKQGASVLMAPVSGYDRSTMNTFYVPEYLFNDPSKGAYIEIIGHFVDGGANRVVKYSVKLGDAMDDAGRYGDKYHITRNRHYTFTGNVKSYGEMDGVEVKVTVAPWKTVNMDEDTGRYIAFAKVTDGAGTTIAEGDNLSDAGMTLKVYCNTNTGGWYTVTRNAKGAIVDRSAATASVSGEMSQSVSITIPKLWELPDLQSYTVSIYHRTIAQESVGPVKALKFTQKKEGFIPNEVLIAAGWVDNLPPNGLQIAKRGNSGVAGYNDPAKPWKTELSTTPNTTATGLGMGASNTDAMMVNAELHPAAQYCRAMGNEWFLPSKEELLLIYANKSALDASYSFNAAFYWSATENSSDSSWDVNLSSGNTNNYNKTTSSRVRCVRYI